MELNLMVVIYRRKVNSKAFAIPILTASTIQRSKNYRNKMELNLMVVIEEKLILKHLLSLF